MLIAFIALIALVDALLLSLDTSLNTVNGWFGGLFPGEVKMELSLAKIFSWLFSPVAMLMGVERADVPAIADLLGTKLVVNELVAYTNLKNAVLSERSRVLATYALTGFANFASIGIQLGGIGGLAPSRRHDLARLGGRALFVGFLVTLINAALAGILL
jgi:CNT family concentrative nucleoside transporter